MCETAIYPVREYIVFFLRLFLSVCFFVILILNTGWNETSTPSDFHLFQKINKELNGHHFYSNDGVFWRSKMPTSTKKGCYQAAVPLD